jgi:hypothetical protein
MAKIKFKRDTAANWSSANPVLDSGEAGFDTTNNKIKIGNGSNNWSSLNYLNASTTWDDVTNKPSDVTFTSYTDSKGEVRSIPVSAKTSSYTLVLADHGKCISTNSGVIVPASVFSAGQIISIFNDSSTDVTITTSAVTAYKAGADTAVTSLTLAARGIANILFITSSKIVASGNLS